MAKRITKEEALSFLLTHMVAERSFSLQLDQLALFELMNVAAHGTQVINNAEDVTAHEVLEALADEFIKAHTTDAS